MHGACLECCGQPPGAPAFERKRGTAGHDTIEVVAACGAEARVKVAAHRFDRENADRIGPEMGVEGVAQDSGLPIAFDIEMGDLAQRMNTRIGAAGAMDG